MPFYFIASDSAILVALLAIVFISFSRQARARMLRLQWSNVQDYNSLVSNVGAFLRQSGWNVERRSTADCDFFIQKGQVKGIAVRCHPSEPLPMLLFDLKDMGRSRRMSVICVTGCPVPDQLFIEGLKSGTYVFYYKMLFCLPRSSYLSRKAFLADLATNLSQTVEGNRVIQPAATNDLLERAKAASSKGDGATAYTLFRQIAEYADEPSQIAQVAAQLARERFFDGADIILREAMLRFPSDIGIRVWFAKISQERGAIDEEIQRWSDLRENFPKNIEGYLNGSRALRKAKRIEDADALTAVGLREIGRHNKLLCEQAICAMDRSDWTEALTYWKEAEESGRLDVPELAKYGVTLTRLGDLDGASYKARKALEERPDSADAIICLADIATARKDWGEAVKLWRSLQQLYPTKQQFADRASEAVWLYRINTVVQDGCVSNEAAGDDVDAPVDVGFVEDPSARELLMRFESLGLDCEFGLVQRRFGAEPLGLLRWTTTLPETLLSGLRCEFDGVGLLEQTELDLSKSEIFITDLSLNIRFHTFIQHDHTLEVEVFRKKQARNLRYLRSLFLERLREASKIYVYKMHRSLEHGIVDEIYEEVRKYSQASIVVVGLPEKGERPGSIKQVRSGLYLGYLSRLGKDPARNWNIDYESWMSICKAVAECASTNPISKEK